MPLLDPFFSNVILLTQFDTSFNDVSNNLIVPTSSGSPTIDTVTKKYGAGSLNLNGTSYLTYSHASIASPADSKVAFECWFRLTNLTTVQFIFDSRNASGLQGASLSVSTTGQLIATHGAGTVTTITSAASTIAINTWYHIVYRRSISGSATYLSEVFMNGVSVGSLSGTQTAPGNTMTNTTLRIGSRYDGTLTMTGFIDDFRYTIGFARGFGSYVVPFEALPTAGTTTLGYTSLLNPGNGTPGFRFARVSTYGDRYQLTGSLTVVGSTTDTIKRARLIRDRDGVFIAEQLVTSTYIFTGLIPTDRYTLIVYDMTGNYRAVVQDGLVPTLIPGLP